MEQSIEFTRLPSGRFARTGTVSTPQARFQWENDRGDWEGGWIVEPTAELEARMSRGGPYRHNRYRILAV
jgi:hypothetical protein